ncbi:hypothetical protein PPACK8108_LOCUS5335 [Phakopsora pachyrhizi]|uniref:Uncharacterized protein n=1 Tax=Phakopsora pachyrhizi TaxID=170000 RepID=A0AAV0AQQ1_PHAPC|nr:hypothetical protein PPACK8108_LOCUS5335 [Phakopsora pachyrhizi]
MDRRQLAQLTTRNGSLGGRQPREQHPLIPKSNDDVEAIHGKMETVPEDMEGICCLNTKDLGTHLMEEQEYPEPGALDITDFAYTWRMGLVPVIVRNGNRGVGLGIRRVDPIVLWTMNKHKGLRYRGGKTEGPLGRWTHRLSNGRRPEALPIQPPGRFRDLIRKNEETQWGIDWLFTARATAKAGMRAQLKTDNPDVLQPQPGFIKTKEEQDYSFIKVEYNKWNTQRNKEGALMQLTTTYLKFFQVFQVTSGRQFCSPFFFLECWGQHWS